MQNWMALLPALRHEAGSPLARPWQALDALHLGWWALQFTPRVAPLEDAVVLEWHASERLFGGQDALRTLMAQGAIAQGARAWACAPTALGALALARQRAGQADLDTDVAAPKLTDWPATLDALCLSTLTALSTHQATLARLGCRTLGDVRALPRGGLSRRFGADLLHALDQAYGHRPEAFSWLSLPTVFDERLELPGRIESAPALLHAARVLLQGLCAWLAGQQAGVEAFTLRWHHGRLRHAEQSGAHTVRLASPVRAPDKLARLLSEHLQRLTLTAPVEEISLRADEITPLTLDSHSLFPEQGGDQLSARPDALLTPAAQRAQREALLALLDRLSVRLGTERVLQARVQADHRLEQAQCWQPALQARPASDASALETVAPWPQPAWLLPQPLPLAMVRDQAGWREHPFYQGRLQLLAGPHRVESGWWDPDDTHDATARDYYLASSAMAGLLWVFKTRHAPGDQRSPWFLHGFFA